MATQTLKSAARAANAFLACFGFGLTALYVPMISGAGVTGRWCWLAIVLPVLLFARPIKITATHWLLFALLAWSALSLLWTPNRLDGAGALIQYVILAEAFVLGSALERDEIDRVFVGMAFGLLASSVTLFVQQWQPDIVLRATMYSGLYVNSGQLAESAALVTIALFAAGLNKTRALLVIGMLPCLIMPQSRSALLALAAAFIAWVWTKSRFAALLMAALALAALGTSLALGFHVSSVVERFHIWRDAIAGLTMLGHGIGSVWTDYAYLNHTFDIVATRPEHLHNDFLEAAFENGAIGIAAIGICGVWCWIISRRSGPTYPLYVCIALAAESLVGFPLHMATTGCIAALCCGHLARGGYSLRDVLDDGRILLCGWTHQEDGRRSRLGSA